MRSNLRVSYSTYNDGSGVFELMIDDRKLVNLVFDDRWFRVVGLQTERVYFACPREHVISIKEKA